MVSVSPKYTRALEHLHFDAVETAIDP